MPQNSHHRTANIEWVNRLDNAPWRRRDSPGEVVFDGKMWILGGFTPERVNDVWFSEDGEHWTEATSDNIWPIRHEPACLAFKGSIWLMGEFGASLYSGVWPMPSEMGDRLRVLSARAGGNLPIPRLLLKETGAGGPCNRRRHCNATDRAR